MVFCFLKSLPHHPSKWLGVVGTGAETVTEFLSSINLAVSLQARIRRAGERGWEADVFQGHKMACSLSLSLTEKSWASRGLK